MQRRCIPPLGLCYVAASLEKAGVNVSILDCTVEGYDHWAECAGMVTYGLPLESLRSRVLEIQPQAVGLSVLFSTDLLSLIQICGVVKEVCPESETVVGGLHATIYPKEVFELDRRVHGRRRCVDWVLRGEGERRLVEFLEARQQGQVNVRQDGLAGYYRGEFFCNPQFETISDLDSIPPPAFHLLPLERYFEINVPFSPVPKGRRVLPILTTRGCPISCSFCASTNLYKQYRVHSVGRTISEIRNLQQTYKVDEIQFADDNLTLNQQRTVELMQALKPVGMQWCTPNGTMVNTLTPRLLQLMREAGLYQITLSIDSGSVRTLRELHHKPVDLSRVPELIGTCRRLGIWTHGTLVVGMPGETLEEVRSGLEFVLENLHFTSISTFIAQPIPGSELYHQALENGLITRESAWTINSTKAPMTLHGLPKAELERMTVEFQRAFNARAKARDPVAFQEKYASIANRGDSLDHYGGRLT
ncbi:MAG: cobalamin-dependent protein [Verrucomicrobiae bacterium]|nr:cobalamin-dependent protein [Verrucomicrobiae bacterium]